MKSVAEQIQTNQGTIHGMSSHIVSSKAWNSLHTIEELDGTLKSIIAQHFHPQNA